jgi:hypothetical protein
MTLTPPHHHHGWSLLLRTERKRRPCWPFSHRCRSHTAADRPPGDAWCSSNWKVWAGCRKAFAFRRGNASASQPAERFVAVKAGSASGPWAGARTKRACRTSRARNRRAGHEGGAQGRSDTASAPARPPGGRARRAARGLWGRRRQRALLAGAGGDEHGEVGGLATPPWRGDRGPGSVGGHLMPSAWRSCTERSCIGSTIPSLSAAIRRSAAIVSGRSTQ